MVPSTNALPEVKPWMPLDAALEWRWGPEEGLVVSGFGRVLNPAQIQQNFEQSDSSWVARSMRKLFGMAEKPRAPPSSADPSALLKAELGASTRSRRRTTSSTSAPSRHLTAPFARARPSCYSSISPCPTSASPSYSDSSRSRRTSPPSAHPSCKQRSTPSSSSAARGSTPTASSCRARSPPPAASTSPRRRASSSTSSRDRPPPSPSQSPASSSSPSRSTPASTLRPHRTRRRSCTCCASRARRRLRPRRAGRQQ